MPAVLADTHAAIWYLFNSPRLSAPARTALEQAANSGDRIYLSAISLVEIVYLAEKQRIPSGALALVLQDLRDPAAALTLIPLDESIAQAVSGIPRSQVSDMPDRIIAATALVHQLPLVSRDHKIQAAPIQTIW